MVVRTTLGVVQGDLCAEVVRGVVRKVVRSCVRSMRRLCRPGGTAQGLCAEVVRTILASTVLHKPKPLCALRGTTFQAM